MASEVQGYVGVGSNIEPDVHVPAALALLAERLTVTGVSMFYRTAPVARCEQPPFANGVFGIRTALGPGAVKGLLLEIEASLGRRRSADRHAARPIDLDLLVLGEHVGSEGLTLPDPDIRRRAFVALPLHELAPDLVLPDTGEPLATVARTFAETELEPDASLTATLRAQLVKGG
jgi:2-amino-4-hydroxy-6-hydroxymethyldihydropteridine diphosphokinase